MPMYKLQDLKLVNDKGAPAGFTEDSKIINAIVKLDIPFNEKVVFLDYSYGKGRNRIEKDNQEIFLDDDGV